MENDGSSRRNAQTQADGAKEQTKAGLHSLLQQAESKPRRPAEHNQRARQKRVTMRKLPGGRVASMVRLLIIHSGDYKWATKKCR